MDGEALKRRLAHNVAVLIWLDKNFVKLLKYVIANVLNCKTHLNFFKMRMHYYAFLSDESLLT